MSHDNNYDIIEEVVKQVKDKLVFIDLSEEEILENTKIQLVNSSKKNLTVKELVDKVLAYYYKFISHQTLEKKQFIYIDNCINFVYFNDIELVSKLDILSDYLYNIGVNNVELFENIVFKNKKLNILIKKFLSSCDVSFYECVNNINTVSLLENYCIINNIKYIDDLEDFSEEYDGVSETFTSYLNQIGKIPLLTPEEEKSLTMEYKRTGDLAIRTKLIESNLRLVVTVAKAFANNGVPILDLISEGNIGLMQAIDKFDPELGHKLSTYAMWWIRQSVSRAYYEQSKIIKISEGKRQKISDYARKKDELLNIYGGDISQKEIAKQLGISINELLEYESLMMPIASVESKVGEDEESELINFLSDDSVNVENTAMEKEVHEELLKVLDTLDYKMQMVLKLRYGLYDGNVRTLNQTAEDMYTLGIVKNKLTRERIRQLEKRAFVLLRHPKRSKIIKTFYTPDVKKKCKKK